MRWITFTTVFATLAGLAACDTAEQPAPSRNVQETAQAATQYDPAAYDTVNWASDSAAINRGRDIYTWVCAECHGESGLGDGGRVIDGDTIRPPSFQQEGWTYADDPDALHQKIYVGNTLGMPHWGLRQMAPRDIVAVERYIRMELIQQDVGEM